MQTEKECYVCGTDRNLHKHHIFFGTANRSQSEKFGCWCWLCADHHNLSNDSAHRNRALDVKLKTDCQKILEKRGLTRERFMYVFGKNYL